MKLRELSNMYTERLSRLFAEARIILSPEIVDTWDVRLTMITHHNPDGEHWETLELVFTDIDAIRTCRIVEEIDGNEVIIKQLSRLKR